MTDVNAAMEDARDRANVTPNAVLESFLSGPLTVGSLTLRPFTLGMLWILQDIDSPFVRPREVDPDTEQPRRHSVTIRDIARALYIMSSPEEAFSAHQAGELDSEAFALVNKIGPGEIAEISSALQAIVARGLSPMPGSGSPFPAPAGAESAPRQEDPAGSSRSTTTGLAGR